MERIELNDQALDSVAGGSIIFSSDRTTCGLNCNGQCRVNDYDACVAFIRENMYNMSEKELMRGMAANGYITRL